jgi:hypothetical protein
MSDRLRSEHVRAILTELARVGITPTITYTGRAHLKISWCAGGRRWCYFTSGTPSDHRVTRNVCAGIRRLLRRAA